MNKPVPDAIALHLLEWTRSGKNRCFTIRNDEDEGGFSVSVLFEGPRGEWCAARTTVNETEDLMASVHAAIADVTAQVERYVAWNDARGVEA